MVPITEDFSRSCLDQMIDLRRPLPILTSGRPWQEIEASIARLFVKKVHAGQTLEDVDLFGPSLTEPHATGPSDAGRPRLYLRLMISLLYLKHAFDEGYEALVQRCSETPAWQYFSGKDYFENHLPCDRTPLVKFRRLLGEQGVEELLARTLNAAVNLKLIPKEELGRIEPHEPSGARSLRQSAGKSHALDAQTASKKTVGKAPKLYSWHSPEVECISTGKSRTPYEFGVTVGIAMTLKGNLIVGARALPGNPYDGHTLHEQIEQSSILMQDLGVQPQPVYADLGYRGVDHDNAGISIKHRGKFNSLTHEEKKHLKRRQAIEPIIGHLKDDHRLNRCHLKGSEGESLHAVLCAGFKRKTGLASVYGERKSAAPSAWGDRVSAEINKLGTTNKHVDRLP